MEDLWEPLRPRPPEEIPDSQPAATVVAVRDAPGGIETLLLRRHAEVELAGGAWVFPGGRVEEGDARPGEDVDSLEAARRAAAREAFEEARLVVDPSSMVPLAHWTPPQVVMRRYATWFLVAPVDRHEVVVDGREVVDHCWIDPQTALDRHAVDDLHMLQPTWVVLHRLLGHHDVLSLLAAAAATPPDRFVTRFARVGDVRVSLWEGDAGYESVDPTAPGPRHRLHVGPDRPWRYERTTD